MTEEPDYNLKLIRARDPEAFNEAVEPLRSTFREELLYKSLRQLAGEI